MDSIQLTNGLASNPGLPATALFTAAIVAKNHNRPSLSQQWKGSVFAVKRAGAGILGTAGQQRPMNRGINHCDQGWADLLWWSSS